MYDEKKLTIDVKHLICSILVVVLRLGGFKNM